MTLHDVEGLESDEVAKVLGLSVNNVRVLLHRGRAKLQAALAEYVLGPRPRRGTRNEGRPYGTTNHGRSWQH